MGLAHYNKGMKKLSVKQMKKEMRNLGLGRLASLVLALPWLIGLQARSSVLRLSFCCLIMVLQLLTVLVVFADMRGISILFSILSRESSMIDFVWLGLLWVLFGIAIKTSKK